MKKLWRIILSLTLLVPGRLLLLLFVFYFEALTGSLALGYALGCILFGTLAALPVVLPILKQPMTKGQKAVRIGLLIGLYTAILMLSAVRIGGPRRIS